MIAADAASDETCSAHVPQAHITPEGHITWRSQTSRSAKRNTSLKKALAFASAFFWLPRAVAKQMHWTIEPASGTAVFERICAIDQTDTSPDGAVLRRQEKPKEKHCRRSAFSVGSPEQLRSKCIGPLNRRRKPLCSNGEAQ